MLAFPNGKINLGLRILDKREDGFHNLESVFFPVPWNDALEIIETDDEFSFSSEGKTIDGNSVDNICTKAYRLLQSKFKLPSVKIFLYKNIPVGAGLGGGSADGAFTLKLLNKKFELHLSNEELRNHAAQLGSDCPFFIDNKKSFVSGRGENMEEMAVLLKGYHLKIIFPGESVNTGWAFKELAAKRKINPVTISESTSLKEIVKQPVEQWKEFLKNDFEEVVFPHYPSIQKAKENLYEAGAVYASMSGSGSSVFGIFKEKEELKSFSQKFGKDNVFSFTVT